MPVKITGPAPIIRAAIASLEANFAAHVSTWNAEPANTVAIENPVEYAFGVATDLIVYPVVEVSIVDGGFGPFSVGQAGVGDADHTPRLQVVVWQEGTTGEVSDLYEAAIGYVRCVTEILIDDGALGDNAEISGTAPDAIRYRLNPPLPVDPSSVDRQLRKWRVPTTVEFLIEAIETFTAI